MVAVNVPVCRGRDNDGRLLEPVQEFVEPAAPLLRECEPCTGDLSTAAAIMILFILNLPMCQRLTSAELASDPSLVACFH
jgi:hypothetical protein